MWNDNPTQEAPIMGLTDKVSGTAKEAEGKITGDKSREAEGKFDKAKGEAKDAAEHLKDAAGSLVDRARYDVEKHRAKQDAAGEDRR